MTIQVTGIPELTRALTLFADEAQTPRRALLNLVREVIGPAIDKRFSASGPGWPPLSPQYAASKARKFPGRPLLVQSGAMRGALTGLGAPVFAIGDNSIDLTPRGIPYFATHQFGRGGIPARPMIVLSELEGPAKTYLEQHLAQVAKDAGLKVS